MVNDDDEAGELLAEKRLGLRLRGQTWGIFSASHQVQEQLLQQEMVG